MRRAFQITIFAALFFVSFIYSPHSAEAATASLYFKLPAESVGVGDEFPLKLILDSGGTPVNALAGDLVFSDPMLSLSRVETANSIVSTWIQSPIISGNSVTFSGIMPGGYESVIDPRTNTRNSAEVLTLIFIARSAGSATVSFSESHLYLNDGEGTEVSLATLPYTFTINEKGSGLTSALNDTISPEGFTPIVSSSESLYEGAYAVFFSTTDKQSGISHYEVREGSRSWVRAESPYRLTDQSLRSTIRVKAVDLAGNYRIAEVNATFGFDQSLILIPLILLIALFIFVYIFYKRKMRKYTV